MCLKAKTIGKLNSTKLNFDDAQRELLGRTKKEKVLLKKYVSVKTSLLDDIKTKQLQ